MKKKTFKKAGAAVLTMAMLLSMGAMSAVSVSAEKDTSTYSVTIKDVSKYGYSYSKIASLDEDGIKYYVEDAWSSYVSVDANNYLTLKTAVNKKTKIAEFTTASDIQDLATALADKGVSGTAVGSSSDTITDLTPGYYLFTGTNGGAQPMLVEVKGDIRDLIAKANKVTIDKVITAISDSNTATDNAALVKNDGKKGLVSKGATVTFELTTSIPNYDSANLAASGADITDFVVTDIPEDTLTNLTVTEVKVGGSVVTASTETTKTYKVEDASNADLLATNANGKKYFAASNDDVAGSGKKIIFDDSYVLANGGKQVIITLTAVVADDVDVNEDANNNTATVEYNNNFWTGGSKFKSNPDNPNPDNPDDPEYPPVPDTPDNPNDHDQSSAAVFATVVTVNKVDQDDNPLEGAKFDLYKGTTTTGATPIATLGGDNDLRSEFEFSGLNVGTYTLVESATPSAEYKKAANVTFTITETNTNANAVTFVFKNTQDETIADAMIKVTNIKGQTLPATGGVGTIIFTVGGAAIVLLAGAMFVLYMKKRRVEE